MEPLLLPQTITSESVAKNRAKIIIEPCYPGYGTTLGNALRRVLLSSLPGAAVVAVKIEGVDHEFSTIPFVKEDVVDILLNIKQLRLKVHSSEDVKLNFEATGEKVVTAADIKGNSDVEVMSTDLHIATLTDKKAKLNIEFTCRQGRGYVTVENRDSEKYDIGVIAVDAIYSPVQRVGYSVEDVRVGQMTNYDKLTLDIETDGSISPLDAVKQASSVLIDHFQVITGESTKTVPDEAEAPPEIEEVTVTEEVTDKSPKKRGRPKKEV